MTDPFDFDIESRPYSDLFQTQSSGDVFADQGTTSAFEAEALKVEPFAPKEEDTGLGEEVWKGLKRGIDSTQAMLYGATALAGDTLNIDKLRDWGGEGYARNIQEANENAAAVRFLDIAEGENFLEDTSNFAKWAAGGVGELLPNIALVLAGGGVGGAAAKGVLSRIGSAAAKKYVGRALVKEFGEEGLEAASKKAIEAATNAAFKNLGTTAGAFVAGAGLNTGEIYGQFIDPETGQISETSDRTGRVLGSIGGGLLAGALDTVLPASILRRAGKTKNQIIRESLEAVKTSEVAARAAGKLLLDGTKEGTTEALQELIGSTVGVTVDEAKEWDWSEIKPQLIEAFALGALGGGVMGGPVEVVEAARKIGVSKSILRNAEKELTAELGEEFTSAPEETKQTLINQRAERIRDEAPAEIEARAAGKKGRRTPLAELTAREVARSEIAQTRQEEFDQADVEGKAAIMEEEMNRFYESVDTAKGMQAPEVDSTQPATASPVDTNTDIIEGNPDVQTLPTEDVAPRPVSAAEATSTAATVEARTENASVVPGISVPVLTTIETDLTSLTDEELNGIQSTLGTQIEESTQAGIDIDPAVQSDFDAVTEYIRAKEPESKKLLPPPAVTFIGFQEIPGREPIPMFNLQEEWMGKPVNSTVMGTQFERNGYQTPPVDEAQTIRPLEALSQPMANAHQLVNNVVKAARLMGYDVRVGNPDTNNPDPTFQGLGGSYNPSQKVINLSLSETINAVDPVITLHEVVHEVYRTASASTQEALIRWMQSLSDGDFLPSVDPRATDPRLQPDNPYDLPEPEINEELLVEQLTLEGVDRPIAEGIVADIIRILKDLYFRAAMKVMEAMGAPLEETARMWANNRVAAIIAGQSPHMDLTSIIKGRKLSQVFKNQVYNTDGVFRYRLVDGAMTLPAIDFETHAEFLADIATIEENANQSMLTQRLGTQMRGQQADIENFTAIENRLLELDGEYFDAIAANNEELAQKLVAEAANLAGYNVGPVYHGTDAEFNAFDESYIGSFTGGFLPIRGFFFSKNGDYNFHLPEGEVSKRVVSAFIKTERVLSVNNYDGLGDALGVDVSEIDDGIGLVGLNLLESLGFDAVSISDGEEIIIPYPNQIKSADTITRDNDGQIIPLSQRFNVSMDDIRFTRRPVASQLQYTKEAAMREVLARSNIYIAFQNSREQQIAAIIQQNPEATRNDVLKITGWADPQVAKQQAIQHYAAQKESMLPEFDQDLDSDITYDTLPTEAQRNNYKLFTANKAARVPFKIERKLEKLSRANAEAEQSLPKLEEEYESVQAKVHDIKALEADLRKGFFEELRQLQRDITNNNKHTLKKGMNEQLLIDLQSQLEAIPFPKQTEQLLRRLPVGDNTSLYLINKELMNLDIDWNRPLKDLYTEVIDAIRTEIQANPDTPLSLLLSGPFYERGDASLRALVEAERLDKLRGSALLSTMLSYVKKNQDQALALAAATNNAQEQQSVQNDLTELWGASTDATIDALKAMVRSRPAQSLRDKLVIQMANKKKAILRKRKAIELYRKNMGLLATAIGETRKFYDRLAVQLNLMAPWQLVDGAQVPTDIDYSGTPDQVLSPKGTHSKMEKIDLTRSSLPSGEKLNLAMEMKERGQDIIQYLKTRPESERSTQSYRQLERMGQLLLENVIENDINASATKSLRNLVRSIGDRSAQSATQGGSQISQMTRAYDRNVEGHPKIVVDGARISGMFYELLKQMGIRDNNILLDMLDLSMGILEQEQILEGDEAFDAMIAQVRTNPTYNQALQEPKSQNMLKDYLKEAWRQSNEFNKIQEQVGNFTRDESIQIANPITGKMEAGFRDHLNRGVAIFARYMNTGIYTQINDFKNRNPNFFASNSDTWTQREGESVEDFRARVQQTIDETPGFQEIIVEPMIGNQVANLFPHPENKGVKLDVSDMLTAWDEADGNLVRTAEVLAERYGIAPEEYIPEFLGTVKRILAKANKMAEAFNSKDSSNTPDGMTKYGSDARVDSDFPSEWSRHIIFSESQNRVILNRISAEAAFGRDYSKLVAAAKQMEREIENKAHEYENALKKHTTDLKLDKKALKKELGSRYANLRAAHAAWKSGSYSAKTVTETVKAVIENKENNFDIGVFEELHSFIITGMLQGWKTSLKQFSQIYSGVASMRAVSRYNAFEPFRNLYNTVWALADWPLRMFGFSTFKGAKFESLLKEANLGYLDQNIRVKDSMNDVGVNASMARDNASRFKQKTRGLRSIVSRWTIGKKGDFLLPGPTVFPFAAANSANLIFATDNVLRYMDTIAQKMVDFQATNPDVDLRTIKAEDLGFKDTWYWFDDAKFWNNFIDLMAQWGTQPDVLAKKYQSRVEKGLQGLDVEDAKTANAIAKSVFSVEAGLSNRPPIMQKSTLGRMTFSLTGWTTQTGMVNFIDTVLGRDIIGRKQDKYNQLQSMIAGNKAIMFTLLPPALIFSLFFDWLDEEIVGKKTDVRPLIGATNPQEFALSVVERIGLMGPFGLVGEIGNSIANIGTGRPALSFDERVIWASTLMNMQNLISTAISTEAYKSPENITYNQFIRPAMQSVGLGSLLSNVQIVNNMLGLDNAEARTQTRINTNNALRGAGRSVGLEVRTFSGGGSRSVPYTPHVTNMILSAMSNDGEQFRKSYIRAVEAMMEFKDVPRGEAEDRVKRSYQQRHPIKTVFKTPPTTKEYQQMLAAMSPSLRDGVEDALDNYNRWGKTIGAKAFYGKKVKKKSLDSAPIEPSIDEQMNTALLDIYSL